ncbi:MULTISPECIES: endonuclease [unclassified Clostridioides]|uniref:endonuclease n=1 Tax=unclassified Clostridioides TaxID=2635829 RepID=UPI001D0C8423|nr:GIY-YIG nuclease family protein [Clostridioides sp. ES-S-0001-03]MCC0670514.1 GIY-YIG nuclease family protein [Clostridioides sp. ES-S-0145-01]MCC0697444.1 GIY-YIG nuclease family protein [Clostridioides sp. ES-S-0048-02]
MYYVYKYIDPATEECLYVGKTENICDRHTSHLSNKKENWCNKNLRLEYMELDNKYTMDFYEIYLINKLEPKFNIAKGEMDIEKTKFFYDGQWVIYSERDLMSSLASKRYGINYEVNAKMLHIMRKLKKISNNEEIFIGNENIKIKYSFETTLEGIDLEPCILSVAYKTLKESTVGTVISVKREYLSENVCLVIDNIFLNEIMKDPLMSKADIIDLNSQVNDILKIIDINCEWDKLSEYCSTSY